MNKDDSGTIIQMINKVDADLRERDLREKARRAKLTDAQRQAEDEKKAREWHVADARKLEVKIQKAARRYRGHESMSLLTFGPLLHGTDPADFGIGLLYPGERSTSELLRSCIGVSLHARNPGAAVDKLKFATTELIAVARGKQLRGVDFLATALGAESPAQATVGAIQTATSKPAEPAKTDTASEFKHQQFVRAAVEELVRDARELAGKHKIDLKALPFEHSDICERYRVRCAASDMEPLSDSSIRQLVSKCGYKLASGNRGGWQRELLRELRSKKKPTF